MRNHRTVVLSIIGILTPVCYYVLLYAVTEPWRVYTNDYRPFLWSVPAFLGTVAIWVVGLRWSPRVWPLVAFVIPLFLVARQRIIDQRLRDSVASCANHASFWGSYNVDMNKALPGSMEFADYLVALHPEESFESLQGWRCPGYRRAGTKTGVVFVGGGLRPASLPDEEVLIAFCSWKCHPPPHDHQHCLVWQRAEANGERTGIFVRRCSETKDMSQRIEKALALAEKGVVSYSREARTLLADELQGRKAVIR